MAAGRHYGIVTAAYFLFTLTDGAVRMLVLLHFHQLGYTPFMLASLFLLYETAGIVTNAIGGWLAVRFGIPRMLACGIGLQVVGLGLLSALDPGWGVAVSVAWVVASQGLCGIAKDLTKTAAKSAIKATAGAGQLFRWVAWFTGSKNATKGLGFFAGGALLALVGFRPALWAMVALLLGVLVLVWAGLPRGLGRAKASRSLGEWFARAPAVNLLAAARIFLFGARDVWFVVGLPVFLYGAGWGFAEVAGFLALWTIGYGGVQALAPRLVRRSADGLGAEVAAARSWSAALAAIPVVLALLLLAVPTGRPDLVLAAGLCLFGVVFAVMSSLHSYLVLAYAGSEKAAEDVGFYYAANAAGRLIGIVLSGALAGWGGIVACLWGSAAMLAACWALTLLLPRQK